MAIGEGRALLRPLGIINFILSHLSAILAGWSVNKYIDYSSSGALGSTSGFGNGATGYFLVFALSASVVGIASVVVGAYHLRVWRTDSLSAANAAAVIAGHFTFLAFGFACKEISIGGPRSKKLKALEVLMIILALVQLLYLLALHAGHFLGPKYGPSHGDTAATPGTGIVPKTGNYGTSAASDV
ncbi:unnamed protein product [Sphagnum troendelagicum]|jgi:hypothetical protein|uniref:Uncharacterized protein n=1 Tax=Sphagnum jensenii TaxID=128206 RepID=A0ABP0W355_9BRYO